MSASDDAPDIEGGEYIGEASELGFDRSIVSGIGGIVLAITGGIVIVFEAGFGLIRDLFGAFGSGGVAWIQAFTSDPAGYISESFTVGADAFSTSAFAELGPFLPWVATIVALGVVAMVTFYLGEENEDVPGLGIDLPFIENEEEDEN
ncbi:MAG: hypothetical protein ACOCUO_00465 [archaeon]